MLRARRFTCQACRALLGRDRMAMAGSQAALCLDCYRTGWRLRVVRLGGRTYATRAERTGDTREPEPHTSIRDLVREERSGE